MLQHILAQVLSIFNISTSLEENVAANNQTGVQYDAARLVRLLLIFEPIEPVDGAAVDRTLVPDEEMSAQDPDLNYFLANDGIKERKKESFSLFRTMFAKATSAFASTSMYKVNNDVQFPPTDVNPYRYENSDQYFDTLTNAEKNKI